MVSVKLNATPLPRLVEQHVPGRLGLVMELGHPGATGRRQRLRIGPVKCPPKSMTQPDPKAKTRAFRPRALGEIAIRCADPVRMAEFYENVIGLERLSGTHRQDIIFLRIADGFAGHTSILALLADDSPATAGARSSLHHLALSLPYEEQDAVMDWYDHMQQPYQVELFDWIGWRGIFTKDPEGNTVELVAFDPAKRAGSG